MAGWLSIEEALACPGSISIISVLLAKQDDI